MRKRFWLAFLALMLILVGCRTKPPFRKSVVSQIQIIHNGQARICAAQGEMIQILNCLRDLGQKTRAQIDPDTLPEAGWKLILERTDGTITTYQIKGERYIRRNQDPWLQTAPQALTDLTALTANIFNDS